MNTDKRRSSAALSDAAAGAGAPVTGNTAKTWWGERWIEALGRIVDAARLSQGRWHARSGRVVRLDVTRGDVVARLQGGAALPRTVIVRLAPLSDTAWDRVVKTMAAAARYSAQLLSGEMPDGIEAVFEASGTSLFPRSGAEVHLACTCSEARRGRGPCKHVVAVCYVLGERFDVDPFLIFELRGRTREQLSAALRAHRTAGAPQEARTVTGPMADAPATAGGFWTCPGGAAELEAVEALVVSGNSEAGGDAAAVPQLDLPPFGLDRDTLPAALSAAYWAIGEYAQAISERPSEA